MKSFLYHLQINVSNPKKSLPFYKDLLTYLGYKIIDDGSWGFGATNKEKSSLGDIWVINTASKFKKNKFHRKSTGLNHLAFGVTKKSDVDVFIQKFLKPRMIMHLYGTPKEFPEYVKGYYAVFFEDPDRIKLEVTYIPGFEK